MIIVTLFRCSDHALFSNHLPIVFLTCACFNVYRIRPLLPVILTFNAIFIFIRDLWSIKVNFEFQID